MFSVDVVLRISIRDKLTHIGATMRACASAKLNPRYIYAIEEHTATAKFTPVKIYHYTELCKQLVYVCIVLYVHQKIAVSCALQLEAN